MNLPIDPIGSVPSPYSLAARDYSISDASKAFLVDPSLAAKSAIPALGSVTALDSTAPAGDWHSLSSLSSPHHSDAQIKKVSQDFEGIFMRMMFKEMRDSVQKSNLFGDTNAMNIFESMRDDQLADKISQSGGIGLGQIIYQRLQQITAPHEKTFS